MLFSAIERFVLQIDAIFASNPLSSYEK